MIKKSFTNDKNEIYDLLFNKESQIVTYSYQMEGLNDFEPFDLKDLILDRYSGIGDSKEKWTLFSHQLERTRYFRLELPPSHPPASCF